MFVDRRHRKRFRRAGGLNLHATDRLSSLLLTRTLPLQLLLWGDTKLRSCGKRVGDDALGGIEEDIADHAILKSMIKDEWLPGRRMW